MKLCHILTAASCFMAVLHPICGAETIKQLVYVSHSTEREMSDTMLQDIILKCRRKNREMDITGLLLYKAGTIVQILEGPEHAVDEVFKKIELDTRHSGIIVILCRIVAHRDFQMWNIAFRNLAFTNRMNHWADQQAFPLTIEEEQMFEEACRVHKQPQNISATITRLIALYQRLLNIESDGRNTPNMWSRPNRIGTPQNSR